MLLARNGSLKRGEIVFGTGRILLFARLKAAAAGLQPGRGEVAIGQNGYIQYRRAGAAGAGKTLKITLPGPQAAAAVYPRQGTRVKMLTTVTGNRPVRLDEGDLIAFAGAPGDVFGVCVE